MSNAEAVNDGRWWSQALPFWVSAEQQGQHAAAMFWPGSQAEIAGVRPSRWMTFDKEMTSNARVDSCCRGWTIPRRPELRLLDPLFRRGRHRGPPPRTGLAATESGHRRGRSGHRPAGRGPEGARALRDHRHRRRRRPRHGPVPAQTLDAGRPDRRLQGSGGQHRRRGQRHARAGAGEGLCRKRVPEASSAPDLLAKGEIPKRFHYGRNPRVPAIVCLSEKGWYTTTRRQARQVGRQDGGAARL
jgi:hypothetical protein